MNEKNKSRSPARRDPGGNRPRRPSRSSARSSRASWATSWPCCSRPCSSARCARARGGRGRRFSGGAADCATAGTRPRGARAAAAPPRRRGCARRVASARGGGARPRPRARPPTRSPAPSAGPSWRTSATWRCCAWRGRCRSCAIAAAAAEARSCGSRNGRPPYPIGYLSGWNSSTKDHCSSCSDTRALLDDFIVCSF